MIVHTLNVHIFAEERTGGDYPLHEEHWINQPLQVVTFINQSIKQSVIQRGNNGSISL